MLKLLYLYEIEKFSQTLNSCRKEYKNVYDKIKPLPSKEFDDSLALNHFLFYFFILKCLYKFKHAWHVHIKLMSPMRCQYIKKCRPFIEIFSDIVVIRTSSYHLYMVTIHANE